MTRVAGLMITRLATAPLQTLSCFITSREDIDIGHSSLGLNKIAMWESRRRYSGGRDDWRDWLRLNEFGEKSACYTFWNWAQLFSQSLLSDNISDDNRSELQNHILVFFFWFLKCVLHEIITQVSPSSPSALKCLTILVPRMYILEVITQLASMRAECFLRRVYL